ncbi:MAG: S53 family peptidase [Ktedonobacteraceae bacterium]|nr:S53 family peptidase [Ktedonobacteraceae bacterium]MBV9710801.1 S53 family peptidase [Ktedonobacteraceae bacterium]
MNYSIHSPFLRIRLHVLLVMSLLLLLVSLLATGGFKQSNSRPSQELFHPLATTIGRISNAAPTDAQCRAKLKVPCYSPQEIRNAYDVTPLIKAGYTGKGQTIVIIDSFGSPTLVSDLKTFDAGYGLPDPPSVKQLAPLGSVPFNPNNSDQVGWAEETSLDVQWSHALAPAASIVVLTSPVSETQGVQGMPQFLTLEKYALDHHLGKIISQSWGTTENTLFGKSSEFVFDGFEAFYRQAAREHVSVFASAGDSGTANPDVAGKIYPFPTVGYPASSPNVTAVGGTSLYADTKGNYQSERVWNDLATQGIDQSATGGGISQFFREPDYQRDTLPGSVQKELKGHRGLPDISYNADPYTSVPVYLGFLGKANGFYLFGGTSEGSPQWAGITADANQYAHRPLGFLNPALYQIGRRSSEARESYHDITVGNNGTDKMTGYQATPGWDAATGWGTPKTAELVEELAHYCY